MTLLGGVTLNGFSFDEGGSVGFNENYLDDVIITVPCVIEDLPANELNEPRQTDTGTVSSALAQFDDDADALAWTLDQLSTLDHVTLEQAAADERPGMGGYSYILRGPNGRTESVDLNQNMIDEAWQLDFVESGVRIECTYDPDAHARFDGESYELYPPYSVHSPNTREPHSAIGEVWRYLLTIPNSRPT